MTPKEKAAELLSKFQPHSGGYVHGRETEAKACAVIAVEEILNELVPSDFKNENIYIPSKENIGTKFYQSLNNHKQ